MRILARLRDISLTDIAVGVVVAVAVGNALIEFWRWLGSPP
jgi:hypothetical protein